MTTVNKCQYICEECQFMPLAEYENQCQLTSKFDLIHKYIPSSEMLSNPQSLASGPHSSDTAFNVHCSPATLQHNCCDLSTVQL